MPERARPLREPAIWILLVTVVVHVIRRNVLDVTVFLGTAALALLLTWWWLGWHVLLAL